jgi:hypothetical protein
LISSFSPPFPGGFDEREREFGDIGLVRDWAGDLNQEVRRE